MTIHELYPPMPLEAWRGTKETLHRWVQIVGKVRLAEGPPRNHWWHVPFHVTGRGITTRPMGTEPIFTIDFDFVDHSLLVSAATGERVSFPLAGHSVASFHEELLATLGALGIAATIDRPYPFDLGDDTPFATDTTHAEYDPRWANRYWRVLAGVNLILEEFAGWFSGKTSPVHHFWHTFDIAVTRFSDRVIPQPPPADAVTAEAYSREVVSFGFWFGDDQFDAPAFYSYTAPEPEGLASQPLEPERAMWLPRGESHLAVLGYDDMRASPDPNTTALAFLDSAYRAGAGLAGWDIAALAAPGGSTWVR